ncbi:MAG: OmpH family outer membrane protein [Alistipes sp.]|nr:OmpH family outer membrane protein [Alistipes sp.]
MKKVIKLTLAVALTLSASSLFAQKFGRINTQEILLAMPETKEMNTNMQAYGKDLEDNLETIAVEFNQKLAEYQKNYASYSDAVRQLKEKELQELQNRRQEFEQIAQQDYQKKQQELLTPIIEKAKNAIDKVAKANGYMVVFDTATGSLASFDEATLTDLAPLVRAELGITEEAPAAE